jgi:poly-gamma-glutamate capsule biosynthesis protein CapA/YwtB (metallophosphatase superfamily)
MGHRGEILDFQVEIAHAAIDSGADVVIAHAEHYPLAIEIYRDKPIFYGLSSFCFIKSNKRFLKGWVGVMARVTFENHEVSKVAYSLVRQNDATEVLIRPAAEEAKAIAEIQQMSARFKTRMEPAGDEVIVTRKA